MAEEETEYVSDPEDAKLSLKMRRRVASDDEEEKDGGESKNREEKRIIDQSDVESEGAAADYEEEEDYDLDEYVEEDEYGQYDEKVGSGVEIVVEKAVEVGRDAVVAAELMEEKEGVKNSNSDAGEFDEENGSVVDGQHGEEKKEVEPFAVPTAGAFYMHDNRFRDNAVGRQRRMLGGRKLWESKDDRKWGHDKFEELTVQERHQSERRRGSRGRNRGRGRHRGTDRGYVRGDRPREYSNNSTQNHENQNNAPKAVRGRGPRRYQPSFKNDNDMLLAQNKQSGKLVAKPSHVNSTRISEPVTETDEIPSRKQVSASSLNIASPPFYPSGSSVKDDIDPHRRDVQAGRVYRNGQPSVVDENFTMAQSTAMMRGKNIADSMGTNKLCIDDSLSVAGKSSNSPQIPRSGFSSNNPTQAQFRGQGRRLTSSTPMAYQSTVCYNQVNRAPPPSQFSTGQKNPVQSRAQSYVQASGQQFRRATVGAKASSPKEAARAVNAFQSGETESSSESSKSNAALVAKGKDSMQGNGRGSFIYGGTQVMGVSGNMASGHGDQNFPTFLPVMQFGGQHPGGIGVPAVGMAFPGYVGQPQHGSPQNSEMTWLPVLAGAAGGLGPNFCPPYIAVDGSYHVRPPGSASIAAGSSKESNATKVGNDSNPAQRPELANDDFGQRQKNPRRYTEMKFDL